VESLRIGYTHSNFWLTIRRCKQPELSAGGRSWYAFEPRPTAILGKSSTLSNPAFLKIGMPFFIASSPVHNRFQTCASRTHAVGSVSTRDPPIFSIRVLHFQMDRVAVAQFIFSGTSTEANFWSNLSANVTDTFWLCNDFVNSDQKSLFATFQSHSSISSNKTVHELQHHSINVRTNCAGIFCFYDIFMSMSHVLINLLQQGLLEYS